jgi:hypothetical protein
MAAGSPLPSPSAPRRWTVLILAWLCFYVFLGVRTLALDDARYGWGMFSKQIDYWIDFYWITESGESIPMKVRSDFKGEARNFIDGGRHVRTRYGSGMIRHAVTSYLDYRLDRADRPAGSAGAGARIEYSVNHSEEFQTTEIVLPRQARILKASAPGNAR